LLQSHAYIPLRCKSDGLYRCHIFQIWQYSGAYLLGGYALLNLNIIKKNEHNNEKERIIMSQEDLRNIYIMRLEREKQSYIAKTIGIDAGVLSKFRNKKIDLYPHLFEKLEAYLLDKQ